MPGKKNHKSPYASRPTLSNRIIALYRQGVVTAAIAERLGCSKSAVTKITSMYRASLANANQNDAVSVVASDGLQQSTTADSGNCG